MTDRGTDREILRETLKIYRNRRLALRAHIISAYNLSPIQN